MKNTESLVSQITARIQNGIISGEIKSGQVIKERDLGKEYNVSRTPIKEALKILESEGWIEISPRKETKVSTFSASDFEDALEVRLSVETLALKLTMQQELTEEEISKIHESIEILDEIAAFPGTLSNDQIDTYNNTDNWFHDFIYSRSGSKLLQKIHRNLQAFSARTYSVIPIGADRAKEGAMEICRILQGILSGQFVTNEIYLKAHITNSTMNKIDWLRNAEGNDDEPDQQGSFSKS